MKRLISILFLLISVVAIGQNVTIDYQTWNPSGTTCSLFVNPTNVPATGTASGTIEHQRKLGETVYNNADLSIQMQTIYQITGGVSKGARYRIAYNFKVNYNYIIYVTAAAVENTVGFPTGPFIRLDVNNNGGGGSTGCNGPETVNYNAGGNPAAVKLSSNSFQEFQFVFPPLGTQSTLEVTAFPEINGGTKTVRIRKVRIVETPPAVSFTLPTNTPITCGSTTPIAFTVTNGGGTTGITNYAWNLGATPNGWLLPNGSAAPATYSTGTTNSLTLTPLCGATQKNISATVTANGNNYNTNTSTVSITPPSMSISGSGSFCSGTSVYTVSGVPCNATVTWSASPSGKISLSPSGSSVTATKIGNGLVTLTATVNACNNFAVNYGISVGTPEPAYGIYSIDGTTSFCSGTSYGFELLGPSGDPQGFEWIIYGPTQTTHYYNQGDQVQLTFTETGTNSIAVIANNSCGGAAAVTTTVEVSSCGWGFRASPNPVSSSIYITLDEQTIKNSRNISIRKIEITDKFGNIVKQFSYGINNKQASISISNLKPDVYYLRVFNGKEWKSKSIVKQ